MTSSLVLHSPADNVSAIVDKTKVIADRLRCAIIHQENLTKHCFDTNATELSKTIESLKKSYLKLEEECQKVKEEIKAGEKRLSHIIEEHKKLLEENIKLKNVENGFSDSKTVAGEHEKIANDLRRRLQAYKLLTCVRFDFKDALDVLTGYVASCGDKPAISTLIPFEIDPINDFAESGAMHKFKDTIQKYVDYIKRNFIVIDSEIQEAFVDHFNFLLTPY